jgi:arylsulfatase A-like enzyme
MPKLRPSSSASYAISFRCSKLAARTWCVEQAGYHTALVGKWHVASPPTGFHHTCILPGQGVYHDPVMIANSGRVQFRGYVDDIIADQALEVLKSRPPAAPFCLMCQFKAPHRSWQPAERFRKAFEDVTIPEPSTFNATLDDRPPTVRAVDLQIADMPDFKDMGVAPDLPRERRKRLNFQQFMKQYYRVLLGVDENVGRVLDFLDRRGLAENTLVIYASDNGFFAGEYGLFDKRLMYEPSIRVPMLVRYPAGLARGRVDQRYMVLNNDIAHTVLDYAGVPRPASMRGHGESWRPLLEDRPAP